MLHGEVPGGEAGGRGEKPQEEQVRDDEGVPESFCGKRSGEGEGRGHEQEAPSEDALGGGQGLVAGFGDAADKG